MKIKIISLNHRAFDIVIIYSKLTKFCDKILLKTEKNWLFTAFSRGERILYFPMLLSISSQLR